MAANGFIRNYYFYFSDRLALLSSQISTINFNRVAIIVLLLSGVLAFHEMWVGQLGSGVGIFNGIFLVTAVKLGIDLFIYIVSALVLLISETQVLKYQLNNEEPASTTPPSKEEGSSNVEVQSIGKLPLPMGGVTNPPRTLKIIAVPQHPLIVLFSVLGMSCLISSSDFITIFLSIVGLLFKVAAPFHMYVFIVTAWLTTMPKISLFLFILEFQ